eukprot:TRINITY_DN45_c0_g2_i1.p1 TRINITY_DN45_c0_g2~~TRINITY_DN45_c0_g2_i1.p1  ORF type:complete len:215 (+),score=44.36 TRINITY_DN45_c0_g2_i1:165-809(+)
MGILVFIFVFARPPFSEEINTCPWFEKIKEKDWSTYWMWQFHGESSPNTSEDFQNLIENFLKIEQADRITIPKIKEHKWYKEESYDDDELKGVMNKIASPNQNPLFINREGEPMTVSLDNGTTSRGIPALPNWDISPASQGEEKDEEKKPKPIDDLVSDDSLDFDEKDVVLQYNPCVRVYTIWTTLVEPPKMFNALQSVCDEQNITFEKRKIIC